MGPAGLCWETKGGAAQAARLRTRRRGFAEEVLRAYAYQCAMCGFDGALGRYPVGIEVTGLGRGPTGGNQ
jgi:hypothetical protein